MLWLVRHGRPLVDRGRPAHDWPLDPAYDDDVRALRGRLPRRARWYSSSEPKALMTARLLTDDPVEVVPDLPEHERRSTGWVEDFDGVVRRAFAQPEVSAYDGWEPLALTRERVVAATRDIGLRAGADDVVLVGHGTAWTLLRSALLSRPPDLTWWANLAMPDVVPCGPTLGAGDIMTP